MLLPSLKVNLTISFLINSRPVESCQFQTSVSSSFAEVFSVEGLSLATYNCSIQDVKEVFVISVIEN